MSSSKRQDEGYLLVDHRESPGVPDGLAHAAGLPPGANRGVFEAPTITCNHCCKVLVVNPLRRRDRAWCAKCDKYICDECGAIMALSGVCRSIPRVVEELQEAAAKGATPAELQRIINPPT
jgi:hypothetical protein